MAKDSTGATLNTGDLVSIKCRVVAIHDTHFYGIVFVKPDHEPLPHHNTAGFNINSAQVELVERAPQINPNPESQPSSEIENAPLPGPEPPIPDHP